MNKREKNVALWLYKTVWDADYGVFPEDLRQAFPQSVSQEEIDAARDDLIQRGLIHLIEGELNVTLEGLEWEGGFAPKKRAPRSTGPGSVCSFDGCSNHVCAKKLCQGHYRQLRRGGELRPLGLPRELRGERCEIEGCTRGAKVDGLCREHDRRKRVHGDPLALPRKVRPRDMSDAEHAAWCLNECERTEDGCLIWPHGRTASGYAATSTNAKTNLARYLVARHYLPERPEGKRLHNSCGDKLCIAPEHLAWASQTEICIKRSQLQPRSRRHLVSEAQVIEMRRRRKAGATACELAKVYGIAVQTVYAICAGRIWKWVRDPKGEESQ